MRAIDETTPECQSQVDGLPANDDWGVGAADLLLARAHACGASDLHLMAQREGMVARARRHGDFVLMARLPAGRCDLLVARLKVLARLPAFIHHEPQDGRLEWMAPGEGGRLLLRAAFLPTLHGSHVVIRFPERTERRLRLDELGMTMAVHDAVQRLASVAEGTILLTGPSGSGKTTTLYAMMDYLHRQRGDRLHFVTIEDPVERDLPYAAQVQVNEAQGMTFDKALRASLRQDPNVLLVGEIRDPETARVAIHAGVTGHLVLSTLHAGRAARVYTRLLSMGLEPYLVASALVGSVAQRLARVLCEECREHGPLGTTAPGCEVCGWTGHRGRTALYEVSPMSEPLRELVLARAAAPVLASEAIRRQVGDLARDGMALVEQGIIARAELERLVPREVSEP